MVHRKRLALTLLTLCLFAFLAAQAPTVAAIPADLGAVTPPLPPSEELGAVTPSLPSSDETGAVTPSLPPSDETGAVTPSLPPTESTSELDELDEFEAPEAEEHEPPAPEPFNRKEWFENIDKDQIYNYIQSEKAQRIGLNTRLHNPSFASLYSAHGNYFGFEKDLPAFRLGRIILPAGMSSRYVNFANLSYFHTLAEDAPYLSFITPSYNNPVSLSYLNGSIGEGDNKLIAFGIKKGTLFGHEPLSIMVDYQLQNGEWLERDGSGDALRLALGYQFDFGELRYEHGNYKRELSKLQLKTYYWHLQVLPRFENRLSYDHIEFNFPFGNMEFIQAKDVVTPKNTDVKRQTDLFAIALGSGYEYPFGKIGVRYEYRDLQRNYIAPFDETSPDFRNLYELNLSWDNFVYFDASIKRYGNDDQSISNLVFDFNKPLWRFKLGVKNDIFRRAEYPIRVITHPVNDEGFYAIDFIRKNTRRFYLDYDDEAISASLGAGGVGGTEWISYGSSAGEHKIGVTLLDARVRLGKRFGNWEPLVNFAWDHYAKYGNFSMYYPDYRFGLSAGLKWHLGHDNALSLGTNLATFSGYHLENVDHYYLDSSSIMDLWLNLDISRNFEIMVEAKNLQSTSFHGLVPLPFSVHAGLRWYFLN